MAKDKIKLTAKQMEVVKCLQGGYILICNSERKGAIVANAKPRHEFRINNGVFWRLVEKGLIFQDSNDHFNYNLTTFGKSLVLPEDDKK